METRQENGDITWGDMFKGKRGELALMRAYAGASDFEELIQTLPGRPPFMLDRDVAVVYGVSTSRLMEQVRRNIARFTDEMFFQLTEEEIKIMISQNAISGQQLGRGATLYGFTQLGANKVAFYLKSDIADIRATQILKAFLHFEDMGKKGQLGGQGNPQLLIEASAQGKSAGVRLGVKLSNIAAENGLTIDQILQLIHIRRNGLSQKQAAMAFGITLWTVQKVERALKAAGIDLPAVRRNQVEKEIMDNMDNILFGTGLLSGIA